MNSFTKQLRAGQGAFSRESLEGSDLPEVPAEQVEAVMADPVVDQAATEVPAELEQIEEGTAALAEVQDDANTLENTAQILEDAVAAEPAVVNADPAADPAAVAADPAAEPELVPVEDVEPAAAEIADVAIEAFSKKYGMGRPAKLSTESFQTAAARIATYKSLSTEAFEKAGELRARAAEGIKKLIEWFKNFIKSIFDKRTRLENRIAALNTQVAGLKGEAKADAKIKVGGFGAVVGEAVAADPTDALKALVNLVNELGGLGKLVAKGAGEIADTAETDVNPKKLGGVTLKYSVAGNKVAVTKEQGGSSEAVEVAPLNQATMKNVLREAHKALKSLTAAEANFKALVDGMDNSYKQAKAAQADAEGAKAKMAAAQAALQNYQALSKVAGTVSSISLAVIATAIGTVEKSIKAHGAEKAEPAAAAAAA